MEKRSTSRASPLRVNLKGSPKAVTRMICPICIFCNPSRLLHRGRLFFCMESVRAWDADGMEVLRA